MRGSLTYGPKGRLVSILAGLAAVSGHLEARGIFNLLPEKYKWIGTVMTVIGIIVTVISERAQGGASKPEVRKAAANADAKNISKNANEEIKLEEINR